jgi:hypothetical protein
VRRLLSPRWLAGHLLVVLAVLAMLRLGLWQWHRATSSNGGIQNYAYAGQWPLFAIFAIVLWVRTLQLELRGERAGGPPQLAHPVDADILRHDGVVIGVSAPGAMPVDDDPEVEAWNARLAALNAAATAVEHRRR